MNANELWNKYSKDGWSGDAFAIGEEDFHKIVEQMWEARAAIEGADSAVKVGRGEIRCDNCGEDTELDQCPKCGNGLKTRRAMLRGAAPDSKVDGMESRLSKVIDQCHEEWLADGTVKEKAAASAVQGTREAQLVEALEKIAGIAPGHGEVCELIARTARAALQAERGGEAGK